MIERAHNLNFKDRLSFVVLESPKSIGSCLVRLVIEDRDEKYDTVFLDLPCSNPIHLNSPIRKVPKGSLINGTRAEVIVRKKRDDILIRATGLVVNSVGGPSEIWQVAIRPFDNNGFGKNLNNESVWEMLMANNMNDTLDKPFYKKFIENRDMKLPPFSIVM